MGNGERNSIVYELNCSIAHGVVGAALRSRRRDESARTAVQLSSGSDNTTSVRGRGPQWILFIHNTTSTLKLYFFFDGLIFPLIS